MATNENAPSPNKRALCISRRTALGLGCAWAASLLAAPEAAFAEAAWWNEPDTHWGSCANDWDRWLTTQSSNNGATLSPGLSSFIKTPWGVWHAWNQWNSSWTQNVDQLLGAGVKVNLRVSFATALFYRVDVWCLVSAFSSVNNGMRHLGWQTSPEEDSAYSLYRNFDGAGSQLAASTEYDLNTNSDSSKTVHSGAAGNSERTDWWTDYESWSNTPICTFYMRRGTSKRSMWFGLGTHMWYWFCNIGHGGTYHGDKNSGGVWFHADGLTATVPTKTIDPGLQYCGRFLKVRSAASDGAGQYLYSGDGKNLLSNNTSVGMWSDGEQYNRQWFLSPMATGGTDAKSWSNGNPWRTCLRMKNAFNMKTSGGYLRASGGGPTSNKSITAVTYALDKTAAEGVWVFNSGGKHFIATDCSGHLLDRKNGSSANGQTVQFHSNGQDNDAAHKDKSWVLEQVWYKLRSGKSLAVSGLTNGVASIGSKLTCASPRAVTYPDDSARSYASYDYKWVALDSFDSGAWLSDSVVVYARCRTDFGTFAEMPCDNYAGTFGVGGTLYGVHLRIPYTTLSGTIKYRMRKLNGAWGAWVEGNKGDSGTGSDAWAGSKTSAYQMDQMQIVLTGDLAKKYDVWYRVCYKSDAVGGFVKNGATAGGGGGIISCIGVRLIPKSIYTGQSITVTEDLADKKLACWTRMFFTGCESGMVNPSRDIWVLGSVVTAVKPKVASHIRVYYHADGELMFTQTNVNPLTAYTTSADGVAACKRDGCDGITAFYTDPNYKNAWVNGTKTSSQDLHLYCRNKVSVTVDLVDESRDYFRKHQPYEESVLAETFDLGFFPHKAAARTQLYYKDTFETATAEAELPSRVWVEAMGPKEVPRIEGLYGSKSAKHTDPAKKTFSLTGSLKLYTAFKTPWYDGFAAS